LANTAERLIAKAHDAPKLTTLNGVCWPLAQTCLTGLLAGCGVVLARVVVTVGSGVAAAGVV
jgi:hypothetical protein